MPRHIERVFGIATRISSIVHSIMLAGSNVVFWNLEVANMIGRFDKGGNETRCDVVLDVTVEEPHPRVVSFESPHG